MRCFRSSDGFQFIFVNKETRIRVVAIVFSLPVVSLMYGNIVVTGRYIHNHTSLLFTFLDTFSQIQGFSWGMGSTWRQLSHSTRDNELRLQLPQRLFWRQSYCTFQGHRSYITEPTVHVSQCHLLFLHGWLLVTVDAQSRAWTVFAR
jgi:hypothetical protein